jgi:hypothetical protein
VRLARRAYFVTMRFLVKNLPIKGTNMTSLVQRKTVTRFALLAFVVCSVISVAAAQATKPTVYKIAEAGVQLDLRPAGK